MKVFKFQDNADGRFAFILAKDKDAAVSKLMSLTSISFEFISAKDVRDIEKPMVILNEILPF